MNAAVINKNAKLQRVPEACADTNWSRNTLMKVAAEANAIIRVGRTVRIDMPVLYKYIDTVYKGDTREPHESQTKNYDRKFTR